MKEIIVSRKKMDEIEQKMIDLEIMKSKIKKALSIQNKLFEELYNEAVKLVREGEIFYTEKSNYYYFKKNGRIFYKYEDGDFWKIVDVIDERSSHKSKIALYIHKMLQTNV